MNYDVIIVELLTQIQVLEKRINRMEKRLIQEGVFDEDVYASNIKVETALTPKMTTNAIEQYISKKISDARKKGEESIIIIAREIHNELGLKKSYPMVCNAMRKCMTQRDVVVHTTESGYSSTLEIKYYT